MNMADRIQHLRKSRGASQEELADAIGVSRQAVSKWESGQSKPDIEKTILLSDYFETTTDYLLKGTAPTEETRGRWNAGLFSAVGTAGNAIGLICAIAIWIEWQMSYAVAVGLGIMAIGTMIFVIGQLIDSRNKAIARTMFVLPNVWILSLIPISCMFNQLDGLLGGFTGYLAPIPLLGNSMMNFGWCWLGYIAFCAIVDIGALRQLRGISRK